MKCQTSWSLCMPFLYYQYLSSWIFGNGIRQASEKSKTFIRQITVFPETLGIRISIRINNGIVSLSLSLCLGLSIHSRFKKHSQSWTSTKYGKKIIGSRSSMIHRCTIIGSTISEFVSTFQPPGLPP